MKSELVEKASKVIPNPPILINLVSRRVKQLTHGKPPLVRHEPKQSWADVALMEIIEGRISPELPDGSPLSS